MGASILRRAHRPNALPVELKAGAAGSMKSLHQLVLDRALHFAVRFDGNPPSEFDLVTHTVTGAEVRYRLRSLPLYLAGLRADLMEPQTDGVA